MSRMLKIRYRLLKSNPGLAQVLIGIVMGLLPVRTAAQTVNTIDVSGWEIAGGKVSFPVALNAAPAAPVTVQWAVADGTATFPADYGGPTSGTLTFLPGGPLGQFVDIPIATDAVNDPNETLNFSLSSHHPD